MPSSTVIPPRSSFSRLRAQASDATSKRPLGSDSPEVGADVAILLVGPTGSGKTPLGDFIEKKGLWGERCFHFDFGANIRAVAEGDLLKGVLPSREFKIVLDSIKTGVLLENKDFHIAEKILRAFIKSRKVSGHDIIILNGLPRHVNQAKDIDRILAIRMIIYLNCSPKNVLARIRLNSGGDREERKDDSPPEVKKKLNIFRERTLPLLDYYRGNNVIIKEIRVTVETRPVDIVKRIEEDISRRRRREVNIR